MHDIPEKGEQGWGHGCLGSKPPIQEPSPSRSNFEAMLKPFWTGYSDCGIPTMSVAVTPIRISKHQQQATHAQPGESRHKDVARRPFQLMLCRTQPSRRSLRFYELEVDIVQRGMKHYWVKLMKKWCKCLNHEIYSRQLHFTLHSARRTEPRILSTFYPSFLKVSFATIST